MADRLADLIGELREDVDLVAGYRNSGDATVPGDYIDALTTTAGEMLAYVGAKRPKVKVGDTIGNWPGFVPAEVLEVEASDGTLWRRPDGDERYFREDDGTIDRSQEYEWVAEGGWAGEEGVLDYIPLRVTKVKEEA
jgi:hypothetical protein